MGLNKYRNEPCECGSGKKFKHCHLLGIYAERVQVVTPLQEQVTKKEARYWCKRYERATGDMK